MDFSDELKKLIASLLTLEEFRSLRTYFGWPITYKVNCLLSSLKLSTITVGGSLSNILFNEEKDTAILRPKGEIIAVSCNFYEGYLKKDGTVDEQFFHHGQSYPTFPIEPQACEEKLLQQLDEECKKIDMEHIVKPTNIIVDEVVVPICIKEVEDGVETYVDKKKFIADHFEQKRLKANEIRSQYVLPCLIEKKKSNRGRKKMKKKVKKRKDQGSGKSFNSGAQLITKGTLEEYPDKYYKPKVYRNGSFTIPGGKKEDLSDVIEPLKRVAEFFSTPDKIVTLIEKHINMQNHKCNVILENTIFDMDHIEQLMYSEKNSSDALSKKYNLRLGEITYALDKHAGITVKFYRPGQEISQDKKKRNKNKKKTLKISQKCKINIDGAIDKTEVINIWNWLNELLLIHYDTTVYDQLEPREYSDSEQEDTEYEDIFEDEIIDIYENSDSDHDDDQYDYVIIHSHIDIINIQIVYTHIKE